MNINVFVNHIFSGDPKPPCTFTIHLPKKEINKILWHILVTGARKIYGNTISIDTIQPYQVCLLDKYIQSLGFKIKYDKISSGILVWFDKIKTTTLCNGSTIIQ